MNEGRKEKRKLRIWFGFACVALVFLIGGFLWEFNVNMRKAEQKRNQDTMESLAQQAGLVAESKLLSMINVLETAAEKLEMAGEVTQEAQVRYLKKIAENSGMERIGFVDSKGDVVATDGITANVAERNYFRKSMEGEIYISTVFQPHISGKQEESIVLSVPVIGDGEEPKGVLYGVLLVENFNIYANSELDEGTGKTVDIIDNKGALLVKSSGVHLHNTDDNLFEIMEQQGIDTSEIVKLIEEGKSTYKEIEADGEKILFYFSPMHIKNWCVVTSLTEDAMSVNINYSQRIVMRLILKILIVIIVLVAIGYYIVSRESRQKEDALRSQIGKDPLTKVYNREAATEKIDEILRSGCSESCAFLILDLDNFKALNDSLGHLMGDRALVDVAELIQRHVRTKDVVCRLGGDEFIVFLVDIPKSIIRKNVEALIRKLNLTYEANGKKVTFSASVGIVEAPEYGTDFRTLYEKADNALYQAKKEGKNQFAVYKENGK